MNRIFAIFLGVTLSYSIVLTILSGLPRFSHVPDQPSPGLVDYTPEQAAGRKLYVQNGCVYCHSQQVRPVEIDTLFLHGTRPSLPSDYVYDRPHLMGTMRTGEDFTNIGRKYTGEAGKQRLEAILKNPRAAVPETFMPNFHHLSDREITQLVSYLQSLGSWKEPYQGAIDEWQPSYWKDIPNRTQEANQAIQAQPTYIYPIFIVIGSIMVLVFAGLLWSWQRNHFADIEEPAHRMIHDPE